MFALRLPAYPRTRPCGFDAAPLYQATGVTVTRVGGTAPSRATLGTQSKPAQVPMEQGRNAPPIFTREQVMEELHNKHTHPKTKTFKAFYSSLVNAITRDPAAMVVPIDDHMVHRGHAVFDTAIIHEGQLYELEEHLDRFLRSADAAKIPVGPFSRQSLRDLIIATASASGMPEGYLRYWLSVGPGGFSISPSECAVPAFYCLAIQEELTKERSSGIRMITAKTPMKSPMMSSTKTVNYLPNALAHMEAEEAGVEEALWIDEQGFVGEGPTMNVAFVSEDDYFLVPSFDRILAGCTMQKVMRLAEGLVENSSSQGGASGLNRMNSHDAEMTKVGGLLKGIKFGRIEEGEARRAKEMMLVGSGTQVKPVIEWDGAQIGAGIPGPVATALHRLLLLDYKTAALTPIPTLY